MQINSRHLSSGLWGNSIYYNLFRKRHIKIALLNSLFISLIAQSNEKKKVQMIKINAESGRTYEYMNQTQK